MIQELLGEGIERILSTNKMGDLTDGQEKVLTLLPFIPSMLSIVGSLSIIYSVVNTSDTSTMTLKRLLLGLSVCDILCTWILPFAASMMATDEDDDDDDDETAGFVWAMGSDHSCTILGFFTQLLFSILLYNVMISYYFLLKIRFGYNDDTLSTWVEPIMHVIAIGYPLLTATMGTVKHYYQNVEYGPGCWITNSSTNPYLSTSKFENFLLWIFGGLPIIFILLSLFINSLLIYSYARGTISRLIQERSTALSTTITSSGSSSPKSGSSSPTRSSSPTNTADTMMDESLSIYDTNICNGSGNRSSRRLRHSRTISQVDPQERQIRFDSNQALLYFFVFLLCYTWTIVIRIIEVVMNAKDNNNENDDDDIISPSHLYPIMIFQGIFLPIQGFLNIFIYLRPNYLRNRSTFPYESKYWSFRRAMLGDENVPPSYLGNGISKRRSSTTKLRKSVTTGGTSTRTSITDHTTSKSSLLSKSLSETFNLSGTISSNDNNNNNKGSSPPTVEGKGSSRKINKHSPTYRQPPRATRRLSHNIEIPEDSDTVDTTTSPPSTRSIRRSNSKGSPTTSSSSPPHQTPSNNDDTDEKLRSGVVV